MNQKENKKYYIILVSILSFFLLGAFYFAFNLIVNGTSFSLLGVLDNLPTGQAEIITSNKMEMVKFDQVVLESEKFKELMLNGRYEYSTSTLMIGKKEPFGGFDEKINIK